MEYAPLHDAVESLSYWRSRRARLPWYRRGARREAARMTARWERRVRTAVLRQADAPLEERLDAARWGRRAAAAFLAMSAMFALAAGATFALLLRAI
jgi:hypothetical protein